MSVTTQDINKLRKATGAGLMDCKKALQEANGDFDEAISILRKKGQKVSASRADRETKEGIVLVKTNDNNTEGMILALGCETDFVAKNDEFIKLGEKIFDIAFQEKPESIEALKKLPLEGLAIEEKISELIAKIGEKVEIIAYEKLSGEKVIPYIHAGNKLGVLVTLKGINGVDVTNAGKDVAMQIAAMKPIAVDKEQIDEQVIAKEIEIAKEQAKAEGKPEQIIDKIAQGKLSKFFKENTLLNQEFVKDNSMSVAKYLDSVSKGLSVGDFRRVSIG